jgi:hypothetical protein
VAPIGVHPRQGTRPGASPAEVAFHRALCAGLPEGWAAWHSLRIRTQANLEGEGDFVIAVPRRGAIVVEVKGGAIEVRGGVWLQNGRPMTPGPREQAHGFKKKLIEKLEKATDGRCPWVAVATAFPDTAFSNEPTAGDVAGAVLGRQDLPHLREALPALADRLLEGTAPPRDERWIGALHALWCETWVPALRLGARVRQRQDDLTALDAKQIEILDTLGHNPRVLVEGGPGTGKTLLAREMCSRLGAAGRKPVLLCWTSALAAELRGSGCAQAWTVRELAARMLSGAGIAMQGGAPPSAWTPQTWNEAPLHAAADALAFAPYDAVVVDEAQDLTANDWELVRAIAGSGPKDLFAVSLHLPRRFRCPEPLARFADLYRAGATVQPAGPIDELRVVIAPSESAIEAKAALEIRKALGDGAHPEDITILSLGGQTRTRLCKADRIGSFEVVRADDPRASRSVVADTFLRFKGLERPWIVVTELSEGRHRYDVRMHVALTRATVGCVVVATAGELAADPRLRAATAKPAS